VQNLFGKPGVDAFSSDYLDGYSASDHLMTGPWWKPGPLDEDSSPFSKVTRFGWPGCDNSNHFFTVEDLFDKSKVNTIPNSANAFPDRLSLAGRMRSSYDTSTFYRLLSQLGTDSAPEPADKMNLNYDNLVQSTNGV